MPAIGDALKAERKLAHTRLLKVFDDLVDSQIQWRPGVHAPGIGFSLWHVSRWADFIRQNIGGGDQIWETERLAEKWGFPPERLGPNRTGTGMGDEASDALVLPEKAVLLAYAEQSFKALDDYVDGLSAADLEAAVANPVAPQSGQTRTRAEVLLSYLAHDNRHLGMIELARGLLQLKGSATA
jgi:uncharacterized damage-inducible protein DinB